MTPPAPKSEILLPLYIYPSPGAWDPLFEAIASNPALYFVVIINPNSGPGSEPWWPNEDYIREIPKLNAHPNVQTVGYVSTAYCKRPIEQVFADVDQYGSWAAERRFLDLGVKGIFFDETPNLFTEEAKDYLEAITRKVKEAEHLFGDGLVIHNPGTSIDGRLASPGLDIATVAEVGYYDFKTTEFQVWLARSTIHRDNSSCMIHGVPGEAIEDFVLHTLRGMVKYIFVTDRSVDAYHGFGVSWKIFVATMARAGGP